MKKFVVRMFRPEIFGRILFGVWIYYKISVDLGKFSFYVKENVIKII